MLLKTLIAGCSKDPEARRTKIDEQKRTHSTLEQRAWAQRSLWAFSATC